MNWFKKNAANIVTSTRIIGTLCLIPFETYSLPFYIFYIWCGVSDVIDGFIARTTHTVSRLGSILDTISDLTLYTVMMIKILPDLKAGLNDTIWFFIYLVIGMRLLLYIFVLIRMKKISSRHTILNKVTGFMMFLLPFMVHTPYLVIYSICVLVVGYTAVFDEIRFIIKKIKEEKNSEAKAV